MVIEKQKLHVGVKGQPAILDGKLYAAVKPDDSFWNSDGTALEITLQKVCPEQGPPPFGCGIYMLGDARPAVRVARRMRVLLPMLALMVRRRRRQQAWCARRWTACPGGRAF